MGLFQMETDLNVHIGSDFGNKKIQIIHNLSIMLNGLNYEQLNELEGIIIENIVRLKK